MTIKEEAEKAVKNGYEYIPPYKLNKMPDLSHKIVKLLTDNVSAVTLCYADMKIVLEMAGQMIDRGINRNCS